MDTLIFLILLGYFVSSYSATYTYYRLPNSLQPERYKIRIITYIKEPTIFNIKGDVSIHFQVVDSTSNITLHARNLKIDDTKISLSNSRDAYNQNCIKGIETVPEYDYYIIHMCEPLLRYDKYTLKLYFSGNLSNTLEGYFTNLYASQQNHEERWQAVTQFEPIFARSAFPCFDEPYYKSKFSIWLGHHKSLTALSNMPLEKQIPIKNTTNYIWSIFEESVPMSTYLVAFTVNDYVYKSSPQLIGSNVTFRTWYHRDSLDQCEYATEIGPKALKYFEETFGLPFPLKKLDAVVVPRFITGGMENWGLIFYAESDLLFTPNITSERLKVGIVRLITHELAHQWFGNLVTMKWWSDLWLNEGFATYVTTLGVQDLYPEWNFYNDDNLMNLLKVFEVDMRESSHPVSQPIVTLNDIENGFDPISYEKGSAVLRMLHTFMGHVAFFEAVRFYLELHKYQNAEKDDLWAASTKMAHKYKAIKPEYDIKTIMDTWTMQTGYPLVKVKRDYAKGNILISQQRYMQSVELLPEEAQKCWWIPLSYTTTSKLNFTATQPKAWLECDELGRSLNLTLYHVVFGDEWILFNLQYTGVYRVIYDLKNWRLLSYALNSKEFGNIHVLNRAQLIDDSLSLAWMGHLDYNIAFDILDYLRQERDYLPWKTALSRLERLQKSLAPYEDQSKYLKAYIRHLIAPIYSELGGLKNAAVYSDKTHSAVLLNELIAYWACNLGMEDCVTTALQYFQQWKSSKNPDTNNTIPVDLRPSVYCTAIRHGNTDEWYFLWQLITESNVTSDQHLLFQALSCTRNETNLHIYVNMAFHLAEMNEIVAAAQNYKALPIIGEYLGQNFDGMVKVLDINFLCDLLLLLADEISSFEIQNIFTNLTFIHKEQFSKCRIKIQTALEIIDDNVQWIKRNAVAMYELLQSRIYRNVIPT